MTRTISTTYPGMVNLSGAIDNPVTITATGMLQGGLSASSYAAAWEITNAGSILSPPNLAALYLASAGAITNAAGGVIVGGSFGVDVKNGAGTVTNAGSISGATGAVRLAAGSTNRVVIDPGAAFTGSVDGGNVLGATTASTLELAVGAAAGTLAGLGSQFINFAQVTVDAGASWAFGNTDTVQSGATLAVAGGIVGGVTLVAGATLSIAATGSIIAPGQYGVKGSYGGAATIVNAGSIAGGPGNGFFLSGGGTVTNLAGGTITGQNFAGYAFGPASTITNAVGGLIGAGNFGLFMYAGGGVTNAGRIVGTAEDGILIHGGTVTNASGGTITGGNYGLFMSGGAGAVTNAGSIVGTAKDGVDVHGGTVTNQSGGAITGGQFGVQTIGGTGTVANAGSISGGTGAVRLAAGFTSRLVIDPGAAFTGSVDGGNIIGSGTVSTLELAVGAVAGTLAGLGSQFINFAQVTVDAGASWAFGNTDTVQSGVTLAVAGAIVGSVTAVAGATLSIAATGSIIVSGGGDGVNGLSGGAATIVNAGTIAGGSADGFFLAGGGTVANLAGGTITGQIFAGYASGAASVITNAAGGSIAGGYFGLFMLGRGAITNAGSIVGTSQTGVYAGGGRVTNTSGGTITGGNTGVLTVGGGTVANAGRIVGTSNYGIYLNTGGGTVTNASGGAITGGLFGVWARDGAGIVTNAGSISGVTGAVKLAAGFANRLIIDPGATFTGSVDGGNIIGSGTISTLELAAGATPGTLSGIGAQFIDFAQTTIDAGASWTLAGANAFAAGSSLTNAGTLSLVNAALSGAAVVVNNGAIVIDPSTVTIASLSGNGSVTIAAGSTLDVTGTVSAGETIVFAAGSGDFTFDPTQFSGVIHGIQAGDTLTLASVADATTATIVNANTLEIARGGNPAIDLTLDTGRDFSGGTFSASPEGVITNTEAPCFLRGTLIRTGRGDVRVESLATGDRALTLSGALRPVTWIGAGQVLVNPGKRSAATPVIVRKGALADNVPFDDLRVTKGHALFVDGVLVPAEFLVNHRTILWDDHAGTVEFYHIELDAHDVLLANGAPTESYRDDGNRWLFRNANSGWGLPPKPPCAPVLTGGPVVDAIWARLLERAGAWATPLLTEDADLHLLVDGARVDAAWRNGSTHVFHMAGRPRTIRIASRAAAPAELGVGRDPRALGVAVRQLIIRKETRLRAMTADDTALTDGFHAYEPELGVRWTDGDGMVPTALLDGFDGAMELVLHLHGAARYPAFWQPIRQAAA